MAIRAPDGAKNIKATSYIAKHFDIHASFRMNMHDEIYMPQIQEKNTYKRY